MVRPTVSSNMFACCLHMVTCFCHLLQRHLHSAQTLYTGKPMGGHTLKLLLRLALHQLPAGC